VLVNGSMKTRSEQRSNSSIEQPPIEAVVLEATSSSSTHTPVNPRQFSGHGCARLSATASGRGCTFNRHSLLPPVNCEFQTLDKSPAATAVPGPSNLSWLSAANLER
jgi:hypothetical protein